MTFNRPRLPVQVFCDEPTRTQQHLRDECDINRIMRDASKTGMVAHITSVQGKYADVSGVPDYHTALNLVREAEELFAAVPAVVRAKFRNDPGEFLAFVEDPDNAEELVRMGLATGLVHDPVDAPSPVVGGTVLDDGGTAVEDPEGAS